MARTFNGRVDLKITGAYAQNLDLGNASYSLAQTYTNRFANGTAAEQAQIIFTDTRSTSGNDDLDLATGLIDAFGNNLVFTNVKVLCVKAADANVTDVILGAEGTNEFSSFLGDDTDTIIIPPGGMFMITNPGATGFVVTAGTGDKLRIAAASGTVEYDVIIVGEGA